VRSGLTGSRTREKGTELCADLVLQESSDPQDIIVADRR